MSCVLYPRRSLAGGETWQAARSYLATQAPRPSCLALLNPPHIQKQGTSPSTAENGGPNPGETPHSQTALTRATGKTERLAFPGDTDLSLPVP